jgi:hypothetical protein
MVNTNLRDRLLRDLNGVGDSDWVLAAKGALNDATMSYVGQSINEAATAASELTEIYRHRLVYSQKHGRGVIGIEVLLAALHTVAGSTKIAVEPFLSAAHAVTAFYLPEGVLIACVTVERGQEDLGAKNLAFARGGE